MFEPKSKEVNDKVATAAENISGSYQWYWLGITKDESDGKWKYKNGKPITFMNWDAAKRANGGNCAATLGDDNEEINGKWINTSCSSIKTLVCEF